MPSRGAPKRPSPSVAPVAICTSDTTRIAAEGTRMSPLPRTSEISMLKSHTPGTAANTHKP